MKKVFATALICTMLFSLAACNSRKPEQTVPESSETETEVTETPQATEAEETTTAETAETTAETTTAAETTETTAAAVLNKKDYIKDKVVKYKVKDEYKKKKKK